MSALPFRYLAHGLGIHSQAPLRGAIAADAPCDVTIRFSSDPPPRDASDGESLIRFSDGVIYSIRDGRHITAHTHLPITNDAAEFLGGNALAIILRQRGAAVLHASCAIVNGCAVAFAGPSGAGKSTLLAALLQRGHSIAADDFIAFSAPDPRMPLQHGFSEVRLWPDTANALGIALTTPSNGSPKATWDVAELAGCADGADGADGAVRATAASPGAIFFLADGDAVAATPLSQRVALYELLSNSYSVSLLDREDLRDEFPRWGKVANALPAYRLTRPRDYSRLPEVVRLIESCRALVDAA